MYITVFAVRYANDTEFFEAFNTPEDAEQLKKQVLASHSQELIEDDVVITPVKLTIKGSIHVFLQGAE